MFTPKIQTCLSFSGRTASANASVRMIEESPEKRGQAQSDRPLVLGTSMIRSTRSTPVTGLGSSLNSDGGREL